MKVDKTKSFGRRIERVKVRDGFIELELSADRKKLLVRKVDQKVAGPRK